MTKKLKLLTVAGGMLIALACQSMSAPDGSGPEFVQSIDGPTLQAGLALRGGLTPQALRVTAAR